MCHYHGGSRQNNENTSSQWAPWCMKDMLFCVTDQSINVFKCRKGHSQGMLECQSINLAPVKWRKGKLGVSSTSSKVIMEITHYSSQHFLTLINCWPSRFAVWWLLLPKDSTSVICQLESVFYKRGPPEEILTNNDTAFRSRQFECFLDEWGVPAQIAIRACAKWQ